MIDVPTRVMDRRTDRQTTYAALSAYRPRLSLCCRALKIEGVVIRELQRVATESRLRPTESDTHVILYSDQYHVRINGMD